MQIEHPPTAPKTNDPEVQKLLVEQQKKALVRDVEAWKFVMGDPRGRHLINSLITEYGIFQYCHDKNGQEMAEKAARQGCAQYIRNQISFSVGILPYHQMELEAIATRENAQLEVDLAIKNLASQRKG